MSIFACFPAFRERSVGAARADDKCGFEVIVPGPVLATGFHACDICFEGPADEDEEVLCDGAIVDECAPGGLDPEFFSLLAVLVESVCCNITTQVSPKTPMPRGKPFSQCCETFCFISKHNEFICKRIDLRVGSESFALDLWTKWIILQSL